MKIGNAPARYKIRGSHRRRAKIYGAHYEHVDIRSIFVRDGWRCQICGQDTPEIHRGTKRPDAPELDHIIPISKGGPHAESNVQCLCRACNRDKGNKMPSQFLECKEVEQ